MSEQLTFALGQINPLVGDVWENARKVLTYAERARDHLRARLILFPELTLTSYPPEDLLLRADFIAQVEVALEWLVETISGIDVVVGFPRREADGIYNCAGLIRNGALNTIYRKQTLPNYGVFDEMRYFCPGNSAALFECGGVSVALTICEDVWRSEPVAQAREAGAQLILNLNASPFHLGKGHDRLDALQQRTRESGLPIVYVNQVGGQDELVFDGHSLAINSQGDLVMRAPPFVEGLYPLELAIGPHGVEPQAAEISPVDEDEASIYLALVLGVRDYVEKNNFPGAILGLSGGIDSALTLALAVDALGAERVEAVLMPSRYTADMSLEDAKSQAETLAVTWREIPIEPAFNAFLELLRDSFADHQVDVTEENIQARCRGVLLMALSNKSGKILLTTGNKSEMAVGYATLYGDMAGGFAPLKDVPKLLVYRLARYRNRDTTVIPTRVLQRPPSAELAPDQTDQDSLPPYEILDAILERYVEGDESLAQIVSAGFDSSTVERVTRMVDRNEYKRRQAPPGVRISQRAFGRDRRYPITARFWQQKRQR